MGRLVQLGAVVACLGVAACGGDSLSVRVVGLVDAPCGDGVPALFGTVPVRVAPLQGGPLTQVTLRAGSGAPTVTRAAPFQLPLDTTALPDGTLRLVVEAQRGDATATATIQVCVDNGPPSLTVAAPAAGARFFVQDAALAVSVRAMDPVGLVSLVAHLELEGLHQVVACTPPTGPDAACQLAPDRLELPLAPGATADATLTVVARDVSGHESVVRRKLQARTRLVWDTNLGAGTVSSAPAACADGSVVVGTEAGQVALVSTAGVVTNHWTGAEGVTTAPTLSPDGTRLYFATVGHVQCLTVTALTPCAGWVTPQGVFLGSRPLVTDKAVFIGRYGKSNTPGQLVAYHPSTGTELGTFDVTTANDASVTASPALSADGTTVYIGSTENRLVAVSVEAPAAMTLRWTHAANAKVDTLPVLAGDRLYVAGFDGYLYALDPATGVAVTGFSFMREYPFAADVAVTADGATVYAASLDTSLYALDRTGAVVGSVPLGSAVGSGPMLGPGGVVLAACAVGVAPGYGPGIVSAFSPTLDKRHWTFHPGGNEFRSSPVIITGADARSLLVVGNTNGHLYALDATAPAP